LEPTRLTKENVLALYRFALLMNGTPEMARSILLETLAEFAPRLAQLRNDGNRFAFALKMLRAACLKNRDQSHAAPRFAEQFSMIPEPGRSALALLYLKLFPPRDAAALLDLNLEDFSNALKNARAHLRLSSLKGPTP